MIVNFFIAQECAAYREIGATENKYFFDSRSDRQKLAISASGTVRSRSAVSANSKPAGTEASQRPFTVECANVKDTKTDDGNTAYTHKISNSGVKDSIRVNH